MNAAARIGMHHVGVIEVATVALLVLQQLQEWIRLCIYRCWNRKKERQYQQAFGRHGWWANLEMSLGFIGSRHERRAEAWRKPLLDGPFSGMYGC